MFYLKRIIYFLLYSNIYIAMGAFALSISTFIELAVPIQLNYSILVFFSTLFIYNFQRIFYKAQNDPIVISDRRNWIGRNQNTIRIISLIGLLGTIAFSFFIPFRIILLLSPLCILSLAYFFPSLALRRFIGTKTFVLVLVWTLTAYLIPALLTGSFEFSIKEIIHIAAGFSFMAAICIPFDNRDIEIDSKENIKTFAVMFGRKKNSKIALLFSFIYIIMISILYFSEDLKLSFYFCHIVLFLLTLTFIVTDREKRSEYFYIAGIDGLLIMKGILFFLLETYTH
ncbi:MAG: UbiA family prenyltransferase [Bacteroidetes bacterium]|nr:UbiA family prenyltransferase [Bacteroidota bacterium]